MGILTTVIWSSTDNLRNEITTCDLVPVGLLFDFFDLNFDWFRAG